MQLNTVYKMDEEKTIAYEKYERMIKTMNKRFQTYGYERIKTSTFEPYDLYMSINTEMDRREMVKTINPQGEVLVLRPDVTIPIVKQMAEEQSQLEQERRYYYVQDVYRVSSFQDEKVETTQAGVEYFCQSSAEKDAEVIALACHLLKDLGFHNSKIEMGHAGFFQALLKRTNLTQVEAQQLKALIQSKNRPEMAVFLESLQVERSLIEAFIQIPLLYGTPEEVLQKAQSLKKTEGIAEILHYLEQVYEVLSIYGLAQQIIIDLGLMNEMNYYSHILFQGYVERYGRPVLMGGRYDALGNEFGAELPAIGFACTVESLMKATANDTIKARPKVDVWISYEQAVLEKAVELANELRERNVRVVTALVDEPAEEAIYRLELSEQKNDLLYKGKSEDFEGIGDLLACMNRLKGEL